MNKDVSKIMFGADSENSSRNSFEVANKVKVAYNNLLKIHRSMIKADYGDHYVENIDEGKYGVCRFMTICALLGFEPNVVGKTVEVNNAMSSSPHYIYGCPDRKRPDNLFNIYLRNRREAMNPISDMKNFVRILVNEMNMNFDSYFPIIQSVSEENKVTIFPYTNPLAQVNICPLTDIEYISIYGISDKHLIRKADHNIKAAMINDQITLDAAQKNEALDKHGEQVILNFFRMVYSKPDMLKIDPFDVFANTPQSIIFSMQNPDFINAVQKEIEQI